VGGVREKDRDLLPFRQDESIELWLQKEPESLILLSMDFSDGERSEEMEEKTRPMAELVWSRVHLSKFSLLLISGTGKCSLIRQARDSKSKLRD